MHLLRSLLMICVAASAAFAQDDAGISGGRSGTGPFPIGFVNMEKLVEEHPLTKSRREAIQAQMRSRLDALRSMIEQMETLRESGTLYADGSPEQLDILSQMRRLDATLKIEKRLIQAEFQVEIVKATRDIYSRCKEAVARLAEERGLMMVAMVSDSELRGRTQNELVGDILTRPFLYFHPDLDLTEEVLKRL